MISPELCIRCKGKLLCGLESCPILEKRSRQKTIESAIKGNEFEGVTPPGFFVSWRNYPKVAVAPLSSLPSESVGMSDLPEQWYGLPQEKIISFRESLLRSYKTMPVNSARNPNYELQDFQEITMASGSLNVELSLANKPKMEISFDSFVAPMGPSVKLKKLTISGNPKVPKKIENFYSDTDAKSATALVELFNDGFPVSVLSKVLSSGSLGLKKNRKIVPTRWAITAVDSNISKYFIDEKIRRSALIDSFKLFHSNYLDNNFWVMLMPYPWSFEQIEAWNPGGVWNPGAKEVNIGADHEFNKGLKGYPEETEGAYFAARLAIAEHLVAQKKQAAAIIFREIGSGYMVPLGVWQIRENVRAALKEKPLEFSTLNLALEFLSTKLGVPIQKYRKKSKLLKHFKEQKRISEWY
ncbi:MAG: Nre family DNA repair protein [Candidatus Diapherotrites archaeon]|nr:Nre family DNA repair protein [Candidatus Diapherotrites archaeon]